MDKFGNRRVQHLIVSCCIVFHQAFLQNQQERELISKTILVSLGSITMGIYVSWLASVMPKFSANSTSFYVSKNEIAWMTAVGSPGFITGSLVCRFITDRFGRRTTILGSALPAAVDTIIIACAVKAWLLYIAKFLWGVATGKFSLAVSIYSAEIVDKEVRGSLSLVTRFMSNFGSLLMMTIGPFVSYNMLNYLILGMPLIYFAACFWIPESSYYLLKEGKVQTAMDVVVKLKRDFRHCL